MSLVNDMLRDLDTRKQVPANARKTGVIVNVEVEERQFSQVVLAIVIASSILLTAGAGFYFFAGEDVMDLAADPVSPAQDASQQVAPSAVTGLPRESVPVQQAPAAPAEVQQSSEPVQTVTMTDLNLGETGVSLRLVSEERIEYALDRKTEESITFRLLNIDELQQSEPVPGMTVTSSSEGVVVTFEGGQKTDFQLYRDGSGGSALVLSGTYQNQASLVDSLQDAIIEEALRAEQTAARATELQGRDAQLSETDSQESQGANVAAADPAENEALTQESVKKSRGLSLDQQDRTAARDALNLYSGGQLVRAQDMLLTFINENPEAHISRETLATILLGQNQNYQAQAIVDEGLAMAPNYTPYKKLKAQFLIQEGSFAEALALISNRPPLISEDPQYYELLANLFQRNGMYSQAETTYQELIKLNQQIGAWWLGLSIALDSQDKTDMAIKGYGAALDIGLENPRQRRYAQDRISILRGR